MAFVLDTHLATRTWLVGDKCTYADLAFVIWNAQIPYILKDAPDGWDPAKYPNFTRWQTAMMERESVKHVLGVMGKENVESDGRLDSRDKAAGKLDEENESDGKPEENDASDGTLEWTS